MLCGDFNQVSMLYTVIPPLVEPKDLPYRDYEWAAGVEKGLLGRASPSPDPTLPRPRGSQCAGKSSSEAEKDVSP
jgi:hypothetical protein